MDELTLREDRVKNDKYRTFSVNKKYLLLIAGILWSLIGLFLIYKGIGWLNGFNQQFIYYTIGFTLAILISSFGFSKIAKKNAKRIINLKKEKVSIFAFQRPSSYFLIIFMISLGIALRNSFIPKNYLAIVYFAIGGALFLASFHYYKIYNLTNNKQVSNYN